ncbi:MAG TPA: hypothetical protein VF313_12640 [Anaerolineaceae bacterium]
MLCAPQGGAHNTQKNNSDSFITTWAFVSAAGGVAYLAHVGGFFVGLVLALFAGGS